MNKLQAYEAKYRTVREEALRRPAVDLSLLDEVSHGAKIPVDGLLGVDDNDRELKHRLWDESVTRVLGYFAANADMRAPVFNFLSPRDEDPGDGALLAYGAGGSARPVQAAELYARARRPVIVSDADPAVQKKFGLVLRENGVADTDIITESHARNYLENAYYSLALVAGRFPHAGAVTVVTESLVARRALVATRIYAPAAMALASYPMLTDPKDPENDPTSPDNWYASELGMRLLIGEIAGFELYRRFGLIDA